MLFRFFLIGFIVTFIGACGGGSGESVEENPNTETLTASSYSGPVAQTSDIENFRINFWSNVIANNRCGQCHNENDQAPKFARTDDVNLAYNAVNPYVDLNSPSLSSIVEKVSGGHGCWLASNTACADTIAAYISAWAGESVAGNTSSITLVAPTSHDLVDTKDIPVDSSLFSTTVYPILTNYCSDCHAETATIPQSPFFASADVDTAYSAALSRMNVEVPEDSRFVVRLNSFHNCWGDCSSNASEMQNAIQQFSDAIPVTTVDSNLVTSKALNLLDDGIIASSGGRYEANMIAKYEFKQGSGSIAYDVSGVSPELHLNLSGDYEWVGGWGIRFNSGAVEDEKGKGKAQGSTSASKKLYDQITATGEYSIEAWVTPANVTQEGPARIVSYSGGVSERNFTLGQVLYNYVALNRSSQTSANGEPALSTNDDDERLQATLQHVVINYDLENGRRIYVNGEYTEDLDDAGGGSLSDWDSAFALVLGNEASGDRPWEGVIRLVVVHNRILTDDQIQNNYDLRVGQKYYLLFNVSEWVDLAEAFVVFEVSEFDSSAYLFNAPFFISLDPNAVPTGIRLRNMRIGINGKEVDVGQAYAKTSVDLDASSYSYSLGGQVVSTIGTVVAIEKGPALDQFFLTFDELGSGTYVRTSSTTVTPVTPADVPDDERAPTIGLRTFDEVNSTFSVITGVDRQQSSVLSTFETVKQQLPTKVDIESFLSAHQMAVTQLSIEYCSALVDDTSLRSTFFSGFDFNSGPSSSLDTAGRAQLATHLFNGIIGVAQDDQPTEAELTTEISDLLNQLINDCTSCSDNAARTQILVKASCAAVLGSAVSFIH